MGVSMKTLDLAKGYMLLKETKINNLKDDDKILVIKAMRELRPIYNNLETDEQEAGDKMKGENHDAMMDLVRKDQEHQKDKKKPALSPEEVKEANIYFSKYYNALNKYLNEIHNVEIETTYKRISEEAFKNLLSINDFKCEDLLLLQDVLMENK